MELIFVHGALVRDGLWWWQPTADLLRERTGIRSRAVALPSCGEAQHDDTPDGLVADAAALRRELDRVDQPGSAIVVGHSYGGTVIAEAGRHPAVGHLLYIASYLPEIGQSQAAIMSGESDPVAIGDAGDGRLGVSGFDPASFAERFLQDVADADGTIRRAAWNRVVAQSAAAFTTPTTTAGWEGIDSTYLVCTRDGSTSVELQRLHAGRATRSAELSAGHHPFLSRPDLVVEQLETLTRRA